MFFSSFRGTHWGLRRWSQTRKFLFTIPQFLDFLFWNKEIQPIRKGVWAEKQIADTLKINHDQIVFVWKDPIFSSWGHRSCPMKLIEDLMDLKASSSCFPEG